MSDGNKKILKKIWIVFETCWLIQRLSDLSLLLLGSVCVRVQTLTSSLALLCVYPRPNPKIFNTEKKLRALLAVMAGLAISPPLSLTFSSRTRNAKPTSYLSLNQRYSNRNHTLKTITYVCTTASGMRSFYCKLYYMIQSFSLFLFI